MPRRVGPGCRRSGRVLRVRLRPPPSPARLRARRGGLLLALLVLPLFVPTLIFGVSATSATPGLPGLEGSLLILTAISLASLVLGPFAAAAALRIQMQ